MIEDKVLNGTGTGEPTGILATSGVQEVNPDGADTMGLVKAVRRAKGRVQRVGGVTTAVLLNPEDQEEIDLLQDTTGRFYGQGPFGTGPGTLWGVPVIASEKIPAGQALVGDFKQVQLLDREGLAVTAFNQHKDFAQRNLVYVRAELRAGVVIWRPNRLCLVKAA
ncbi:phage major capsid protein [Actinomyces sp. 432]|uniref:phage major capsid protein n=1 Tax=Actinomyces sp. 432 TaxID=2057798 RepID=UPI001F001254|nr:phage major capsid protein [Actinomyces sp. 432]